MASSALLWRPCLLHRTLKTVSLSKTVFFPNTQCGILAQTANYNPKPLKLNLKKPYIPDKNNEKTPEWQKTEKYDKKLFAKYGFASGIDPAILWPTHEQLEKITEEEKEWNPSLEQMMKNIAAREKEEREKRLAKEKLIAANMAKMPEMIEKWRRQKVETKKKLKEEKARRERLLAEATERLGCAVHPNSPRFLEVVAEIQKEEKKRKKLLKLKERQDRLAAAAEAAGISPPPVTS
ncbi:growth arrest and DNA damage-inducible proteins-interacting protein 1 [Thalassophryne amazonica]|uniref:growth arrest and DNA damage-inducible proteins-interacting protein 1 n=1 Tax=Thalassophryne amazonica TaxID=390379 RepID=UPI0014715E18|nr:growth arrest and DNA damage-inducible proteins-interacting protein 1 [Thalassophryne amazonica]